MPIETVNMADFSGGENDYISSIEPDENQWASLRGFVFDRQSRLRSQWAGGLWSAGLVNDLQLGVQDLATIDEYIIILGNDGIWRYSEVPVTIDQPTWTTIPNLNPEDSFLRFAGRIPILDDTNDVWVSGGLLNSTEYDNDAVAIYRDPSTNEITTKRWSGRYPEIDNNNEPDPNTMPRANVASNWGDFFLLGDIMWKADPSAAFDNTNVAHYPHGIWFSEPGSSDTWDPINAVFVGQKKAENAILGMFPLEAGLVIVSKSSISILRGAPNDFVFEELRTGISPETHEEVDYWPHAGVVVWLDRQARVWATNGRDFQRLDRDVDIVRTGPGAVLALYENLFVSGREDVRVLRSFGEGASWSRLISPTGWRYAASSGSVAIGVGADQDQGDFVLDSGDVGDPFYIIDELNDPSELPDPGSANGDAYEIDGLLWVWDDALSEWVQAFGVIDRNKIQGDADYMQAFDLEDEDNRGYFNGTAVNPILRTRPLPGANDKTVFWHRYGVRANGPGSLIAARSYPSADSNGISYDVLANEELNENKLHTFPAHGPSVEAMFEFEFEGDVTPEHVTMAFHAGRAER